MISILNQVYLFLHKKHKLDAKYYLKHAFIRLKVSINAVEYHSEQ